MHAALAWLLRSTAWTIDKNDITMQVSHILMTSWTTLQLERLHTEIPPAAPWLPIPVIHIRPQVKTRQSYKLKKIAKKSNFEILQEALDVTHLLKLLDKMYKYEKDPTITRDRRMDRRSETNIHPNNFVLRRV